MPSWGYVIFRKTHGILRTIMASIDPERITYFAETDARGKRVPFGIRAKDRTRHVYVIGKSGMGKSTLLENMAVQDIRNGEGFAFIDPHGQSADAIMRHIPQERLKDVLYFNPSDLANPVAFNVLEKVDPDKRFLVVAGLMSVFKKIWVDAWSARMEYLLQYTLSALLEYPDATLLGVNRMLSEKGYRDAVVAHVTDPAVKSFWQDEYAKYSEKYAQEAGDAIKNKIGQFTSNPVVRNIIGQPHTSFNLRKFMDERKILIVNLSKGLIGESNANLLGSMLTTSLYLAAMSRADLSPREHAAAPNFYFYVDEFQSFANATFANILSEARKYKLNLTIAHQYVDQMEEDVRNAVFGNVGTTITFRVGPLDAEVLEKMFEPTFMATDIVSLGFAQIYLTMMIDGIGSPPFSAKTLPPIREPETTYYDVAIAESRKQFSSPRTEAEVNVSAFYAEQFASASSAKKDFKKDFRRDTPREGASHTQSARRTPEERTVITEEEKAQHKDDLRAILSGIQDAPKKASEPEQVPAVREEVDKIENRVTSKPLQQEEIRKETVHTEREQREHVPRGDVPRKVSEHSRSRQDRDLGKYGKTVERAERMPRNESRILSEKPKQHDLKNALAAALAGITAPETPSKNESVPEPVITPVPEVVSVVIEPSDAPSLHEEVLAESHPLKPKDVEKLREHFDEKAAVFAATKRAPHEVSPQALAHMMRITLRDKKKRPQ